ncbi:hypothetical protein INP57_18355 [Saccharopolyspora sp. HNM0986]|uniref:hypothetical protein n=1 Tax=Saccharopolyspora galaxeae TaxID=2781241 RepID=UPI00190C1A7B|nr:hypothetical protein [Saccharopolyspora sp. HNM0986]MBK0868775.1 hypothetical protein [Saccharopolyspora sp. HNM0986]
METLVYQAPITGKALPIVSPDRTILESRSRITSEARATSPPELRCTSATATTAWGHVREAALPNPATKGDADEDIDLVGMVGPRR